MSYGRMDTLQREAVEAVVKGHTVLDLGCGDGGWAEALVVMGASRVIALDKTLRERDTFAQIEWVEKTFQQYVSADGEVPKIVFLSWPINHELPALVDLVERASYVVYLGKNTDGTSCGSVKLFEHLSGRKLIAHLPKKANTLTVYGAPVAEPRMLTGEEIAARFFAFSEFLSYDQAEALAEKADVVTQMGWRSR